MLGGDDGFDDRGDVVDVGQCFDAENDVIEGAALMLGSVLR